MNTMTTQQAAERATKLFDLGHSTYAIGKMLAKEGYISFRTGKPVTKGGVYCMIRQYKSGHDFVNRKVVKFANKAGQPVIPKRHPGRPVGSTAAVMRQRRELSIYRNPAFRRPNGAASMPAKFVSMPTVNVATNQAITRWDIAKLIEMSGDFTAPTKRALLELIVDATVK